MRNRCQLCFHPPSPPPPPKKLDSVAATFRHAVVSKELCKQFKVFVFHV